MMMIHELLQDTPAQDCTVTPAICAPARCNCRGKRNSRRRFLRNVIAYHTRDRCRSADLAKLDLLDSTHALERRGLFEIVEIEKMSAKQKLRVNDLVRVV